MWAERGGLDFDGRARWDAWAAIKGMDAEKAKLRFVKVCWLKGLSLQRGSFFLSFCGVHASRDA